MADSNDVEMAATQPTGDQTASRSKYDLMYDPKRDTAKDVRNAMLVVAALISAATFAAGINPPGGVWQGDIENSTQHSSGKSVLGTNSAPAYKVFYFLNAVAFSSANVVISNLVYRFPYYPEIWAAMVSMSGTYGVSVAAVSPPGDAFYGRFIWFAIAVPYIIRIIVHYWKKWCAN
ncbi:putative PGG domain-containing protein [Rosa chinensis]|uniref:Putative PGG domain-containing protein n=1 Tax=Rosa chinensis TaxID=74649 RepID=A0A2P6RVN2_ROSCH|nr:uncharacterized protein LOC112189586 [Rosa chinensis]PRQ50478.1 putative PGG domain-containing protein [Rosa chinensis]